MKRLIDYHLLAWKDHPLRQPLLLRGARQVGKKFKYSTIEGNYRKRELAPALSLLETAGVVHKIFFTSGHGIPLEAQIDQQDYKTFALHKQHLITTLQTGLLTHLKNLSIKDHSLKHLLGKNCLPIAIPIKRKATITGTEKHVLAKQR